MDAKEVKWILSSMMQVLPVLLVITSSYFLIKGQLNLVPKNIAVLSKTAWDYDLMAASSLCHQRADTIIGFVLMLTTLIPQMIMWWFNEGLYFKFSRIGIMLAVALTLILAIIANCLSQQIYTKSFNEVRIILTKK